MEKIGLHNYEAWLLDYSEGLLTEEQVAALTTFLLLHPEIEIDLENLSLPRLDSEDIVFPNHALLQKELSSTEEIVLSYLENTLSEAEKTVFELRLKHEHELRDLLLAYSKTVLQADTINLPDKAALYKTEEFVGEWPEALLYVENSLSANAAKAFEAKLLSDTELRKETDLYKASKLVADVNEVYPNKEELLREPKVITLFSFTRLRIAAAIALFISIAGIVRFVQLSNSSELTLPNASSLASAAKSPLKAGKIKSLEASPIATVKETKPTTLKTIVGNESTTTTAMPEQSQLPPDQILPVEQAPQLAERISAPVEASISATAENSVSAGTDNGTYFASVNELEIGDDFSALDEPSKKGAMWRKAVEIAHKVNRMGFTAVNGTEETRGGQRFILSFNSITVEKK